MWVYEHLRQQWAQNLFPSFLDLLSYYPPFLLPVKVRLLERNVCIFHSSFLHLLFDLLNLSPWHLMIPKFNRYFLSLALLSFSAVLNSSFWKQSYLPSSGFGIHQVLSLFNQRFLRLLRPLFYSPPSFSDIKDPQPHWRAPHPQKTFNLFVLSVH